MEVLDTGNGRYDVIDRNAAILYQSSQDRANNNYLNSLG